jgi:GT2 family glycosyltransferase
MDASVVMPTYNRRETVLESLRMLAAVDYPSTQWEALVVDDGSQDGTADAVTAFASDSPFRLRLVRQSNGGPASARNAGARAALGRYLVFVDDDISVPPSFLRGHIDILLANPGCWIVGKVANPPEIRATPFGRYRDGLSESFQTGSAVVADTDLITSANLSMPRDDFLKLGGFDTDFRIASCEDMLLGLRARAAGIPVLFDPGITVVHRDWAVDLPRFCERQRLYAISDALLWRKLGDASPRRQVIAANGPLRWHDSAAVMVRKIAKHALATAPGRLLIALACRGLERVVPDAGLTRRAYELAVAGAIFRGVREGLRRYPEGGA